ncbi:hypothetical protein, partial [Klebsiella aerogenes]|uniref:hypothetical protein n=1 Tax=Klebsiella aerogenes TaxID=548 RepID=UPI0013CF527E
ANSVLNLTGTNSWTGIKAINSGVTLQGSTNSISGGSIVDNGTLTYSQGTSGTIAQAISGTGALVVTAGGAVITLTGANT